MATVKILVLMAEMGFGHKSAAEAIAAAAEAEFKDRCEVIIANPMSGKDAPAIFKRLQNDYDEAVQDAGSYELLYQLGDTPLGGAALEGGLSLLLRNAVEKTIREHQPDVIISVKEDYLAPLSALFELTGEKLPVMTVVTDLTTIHRMWFHSVADICVVPTKQAALLADRYGLPERVVRQIGVPVSPVLSQEKRSKAELRDELGWRKDRITALVVGSKRVRNLPDKLRGVNHSGLPLQLALVSGGDDDLYRQFERTEWHLPTHIYNYVENLPMMMHAADVIISKAGGLIISETLAVGLPLLLADVIEGQETGNANFIVNAQAGAITTTAIDLLETL
ncbi:MAG: hypothetical protein KC496_04960, partial [Anaerolineae bacterium]|nr:hypothetical protein [Anaerolineae bacterium]